MTWSSQSLRMSARNSRLLLETTDDEWALTVIGIVIGALPCAWAMFMPFETARAARALKKATSAVRAIGIGRVADVLLMLFLSVGGRSAVTGGRTRLAAAASPATSTAFVKSARPVSASTSGCSTGTPVVTTSA